MSGLAGQRVTVRAYGEDPMQAVRECMELEVQPAPDVQALDSRDVLVRVRSAAVGWVDLLMASGQYQHMGELPYTPGLEYSGEVAWVGDDVTEWKVGDRVLADGFQTGPRSLGAHRRYGGFATWSVAPAQALMALPERFTFDHGSCLLGNYETAYHCLIARGQLKAGETVLVHGASGSTGLAAVHVAKLVGATVIATGRNPDKLAEVKAQGADHVIACSGSEGAGGGPRFREQVKALTGGKGVDVVYDGVGGVLSLESLRCVRFGARFLVVGWASTPLVADGGGKRGAPRANQLPTNLIMMKGLDVLGCPTVISTVRDPSIREPRLRQIFAWIEQGKLTPHTGPVYGLDQVKDALEAKWKSRFVGGCLVHP
ncbi:MAG: NADPH:quinone oxidoreductase family protein [Proteobacteria bacterium]|nr:NADPH:quinone oxidoreductase family protein [Pseudomonadota bacterium]